VVELVALFAVEVHQDTNGEGHPVGDLQLTGAEKRHVAEPERTGGGRRELLGEVVGGSEDDADKLVVGDRVAVEHLRDQLLRLRFDLALAVLLARGRAAQRQQSHGFGD
jgi:hypothetical protein